MFVETRNGVTRMQEVKAGSSLGSGNDTTLHFGLGRSRLKRVAVVWPNGVVSELGPLPLNQRWEIDYASVAEADVYEDVTASAGITATHRGSWRMFKPDFTEGYLGVGQAWGDYDNDGWLDLYVTGNLDPNVLFHNEGDGTFSVSPWSEALSMPDAKSGGAVWADYDNDGWKDLYVVAHGPNALFHNEQGAGFREVADEAGVADPGKGSTATWGDYDNDGLLDLYIANWSCAPECNPVDLNLATDRLYHNNGDGTFEDVTHLLVHEKLLGAGFTAAFTDYDDDGDADIYVVNDALMNPIGNVMWRNDGPGCGGWCWTDASAESGTGLQVEGMGLAVGDMDNDLQQDFYFTNMVNPAVLLTNQGEGSFMDLAETAGVTGGPGGPVGWATIFLDYNNDGWQDIFMATTEFRNLNRETPPDGMHFPRANLIFRNNGTGVFFSIQPRSWTEHPHPSMGAARADYDRDGWEDLVTGDWNEGYRLYRNRGLSGAGNNWIRFRLVGGADVNRDAVGARVYVTTDDGRTQMQEVITGGSLGAGNDTALHFGLGRAQVVNVSVRWPNGVEEELGPLAAGREWTVEYTSSK
ncbi:MAG: hypothetical protein D6790_03485 [Caldilineae bacterium]|nr:MAG: hypothetical protein D6790_03485 [Caldilineae bacterium]